MQNRESEKLLEDAGSLTRAGRLHDANTLLEQACRQNPENADAWIMRGATCLGLGDLQNARTALETAKGLAPSMPRIYYHLAILCRNTGKLDEAVSNIEKAMAIDPGHKDTILVACSLYSLSGQSHAQRGEIEKSAKAYSALLKLKPDAGEAFYGLGFADYSRGNLDQAAVWFKHAMDINPGHIDAATSLGSVYQTLGRYENALECFDRVLANRPGLVQALFGKASALIELARHQDAIKILRQIIELKPDYAPAYINLASALMTFSEPDQALVCCEKALELQPDNSDAIALAARIEQHSGKIEQAHARLLPLVATGLKNANIAVAYGEVCRSMDHPGEAIEVLETLLSGKTGLPSTSRRNLHFCLGSLYDKTGNYDMAFTHYKAGNDMRKTGWDPQSSRARIDETIRVFSKEFMQTAPHSTTHSTRPVFVLGMPRSGTSLLEQILASHPAVFGAGELPVLMRIAYNLPAFLGSDLEFPACVTRLNQQSVDRAANHYLQHLTRLSADAPRVIDKMPGNFNFIGLIDILFPGARIIHCMRDPLDTCLSCYFQDFSRTQDYSYNLTHLGLFYRDYERLMAHWKRVVRVPVLDISYEDLVSHQEQVSRKLVDFCGLEWDDRCLHFHRTGRFVATASYDQVRRPIYSSSTRRRDKYREFIAPLIEALG